MSEELRFFLRTAVYAAIIGTIYWFVSYEWAGSILLAFVVFSALSFVGAVAGTVRATRSEIVPEESSGVARVAGSVIRILGFEEHRGVAASEPLGSGLEPIPPGSIWPFVAGIACLLLALGLVYGPWALLPGIVLLAATVWGWITQMDVR